MSLMHCHGPEEGPGFMCNEVELIGGQRVGVCLIRPMLQRAWNDGWNQAVLAMVGTNGGGQNPFNEWEG